MASWPPSCGENEMNSSYSPTPWVAGTSLPPRKSFFSIWPLTLMTGIGGPFVNILSVDVRGPLLKPSEGGGHATYSSSLLETELVYSFFLWWLARFECECLWLLRRPPPCPLATESRFVLSPLLLPVPIVNIGSLANPVYEIRCMNWNKNSKLTLLYHPWL